MNRKIIKKSGFSLIELLIAFAIIGAILIAGMSGIVYGLSYSADQNLKAQELELASLFRDYFAINNQYPNQPCDGTSNNALGGSSTYNYGGFDGLGGLPSVTTFTSISGSFPTDTNDYSQVLKSLKNENWGSHLGYCTSSDHLAYLFVLQTHTTQFCHDTNNLNYYSVGSGIYKNGGAFYDYFNLAPLQINSVPSFGIQCFKQ